LVPAAILPAAFALAAELLASKFGGIQGIPIYLLLTLIQLPIALWFYNKMLYLQGRHLQDREQAILEVISKVVD
jgi:ABC-2 type transport system permease protein